MAKQENSMAVQQTQLAVRNLYDRYGGMLLGYLVDVLKDRKIAEEYLVTIFGDLAHEVKTEFSYNWCQLQRFAKSRLPFAADGGSSNETGLSVKYDQRNKFLELMSEHQKLVFCGVYYHGRTVTSIALQLNIAEEATRKILLEAFTIIRQQREY